MKQATAKKIIIINNKLAHYGHNLCFLNWQHGNAWHSFIKMLEMAIPYRIDGSLHSDLNNPPKTSSTPHPNKQMPVKKFSGAFQWRTFIECVSYIFIKKGEKKKKQRSKDFKTKRALETIRGRCVGVTGGK